MINDNAVVKIKELSLLKGMLPTTYPIVVLSVVDLKKTVENAVSDALLKISVPRKIGKLKNVLMLREAAEYIQMPVPTFREYVARNEIKGAKIGKSWRFLPEDLDQFVKKHQRKTNAEIEQEIDDELSN